MRPDLLMHIPGIPGLFEIDEIERRTKLPKTHKDHMRVPVMVQVKAWKHGQVIDRLSYQTARIKYV